MILQPRILAAAAFFLLCPASGPAQVPASSPVSSPASAIDIVVTAAPEYRPLAALQGAERFPRGAALLLIHNGKAQPLAPSLAASADASISFDGKTVLFAGKESASAPWQIWELTLAGRSLRRVLTTATDSIRPLYLPSALPVAQMVFAQRTPQGFQLHTARVSPVSSDLAKTDPGPPVGLLTHIPASAVPADVLADGRILFESGFPLGVGAAPELYLVYSDGSGVESYRCDHGAARWGGRQLANGDIVFPRGTSGSGLARFTSPLAREVPIAAPQARYAGPVAETPSGAWLLSARAAGAMHYALKLFRPGSPALQPVFAQAGVDILQPQIVAPRLRPNRHPSGLHDWSYANLLALDARQSRSGNLKTTPASVRLEALDAAGHIIDHGTAPVESDGSFFIKVPGDTPIRFTLLDPQGAVLRQEHGWFWIHRGEQRICVGCHTGPERASENRVPAVLMRSTTPADLTAASNQSKSLGGN